MVRPVSGQFGKEHLNAVAPEIGRITPIRALEPVFDRAAVDAGDDGPLERLGRQDGGRTGQAVTIVQRSTVEFAGRAFATAPHLDPPRQDEDPHVLANRGCRRTRFRMDGPIRLPNLVTAGST